MAHGPDQRLIPFPGQSQLNHIISVVVLMPSIAEFFVPWYEKTCPWIGFKRATNRHCFPYWPKAPPEEVDPHPAAAQLKFDQEIERRPFCHPWEDD